MKSFRKEIEMIAGAYRRLNRSGPDAIALNKDAYIFNERVDAISNCFFERSLLPLTHERILDVGCGFGGVLRSFCSHFGASEENVFGVDIFPNRIKTCKESIPQGEFLLSSGHALPFRDGQFDGILLFTVLSSIPSFDMQREIAKEIQRVLKPEGWILCYDFRYGNPFNPNTKPLKPHDLDPLFESLHRDTKLLTLLPPLARRFEKYKFCAGYKCLVKIPWFRSHHLSFLYRKNVPANDALRIAWLWPHELAERNRARYQRILSFSSRYPVTLFARRGQPISMEIYRNVEVERAPFSSTNLYRSYLYYFLWMLPLLIQGYTHRRWNAVYSLPDFSALIAGGLNLLGMKWISDMVDDPALEIQTLTNNNYLKWLLYKIHNGLLKAFLPRADAVIAVGFTVDAGLPETLRTTYHVPLHGLVVTPNGVDVERTLPAVRKPENNIPVVCYMGGITAVRSLDLLIKAHASIVREGIPCILEFIGPVRTRADRLQLERLIEAFKTESFVRFTGSLPHEIALNRVRSADVCVLVLDASVKNFQYTFPIKLFEYLALGKAVVSTRLEGVARVIQHGINGILVEPNNVQSLKSGLLDVLRDRSLKEKLERNARQSIKPYDWNLLSDSIVERVERLLVTER